MKSHGTTVSDVAIIGAGPAGCATAIDLARAGFSVIVFQCPHKRAHSRTETLSAFVGHELTELGIARCNMDGFVQPALGVISVWGSSQPLVTDSFTRIHGEGGHVDRDAFDGMLAKSAKIAGAAVISDCRFMSVPRRESGRWRFKFASRDQNLVCVSNFLVDATGRTGSSWLRPLSPRIPLDGLIAVVWTGKSRRNCSYLMLESVTDGWFYSAAYAREHTTVTFVTDGDYCRKYSGRVSDFWSRSLAQTTCIKERIPLDADLRSLRIVSAATMVRARSAGQGWCAVGDATFSHDPLSGLGVTYALETAAQATFAIDRHLKSRQLPSQL